ncbi:MAG: hypothetical protein IT392_07360 [Nitrospirae bacterium]|nr:hypothetical protein [Nitrospirota bacterium]
MFMWLAAFVLLSIVISNNVQGQTKITESGSTSISASSKKVKVNVTINTVRIDDVEKLPWVWPIDHKTLTVIRNLDISINGRVLFVPRSVFVDLIDPAEASIRFIEGDTAVLTINGGDGANSYFVRVYFDSRKVKRKMLYDTLFPKEPMQDTQYWIRVLKDQ